MNYKMIGYVISRILWTEGILLLLPLLVSALYREPLTPFLLPMLALGLTGLVNNACTPGRSKFFPL